jgi:four helix bundle protein
MKEKAFDLEDRLVLYCCHTIDLIESLPASKPGIYIAGQLIRSCHSPAFNYGEAQAAESRSDFIHKMRICLKELKECRTALKIIRHKKMAGLPELETIYQETEELIAIFAKSITTATHNKP